jgi:hypothetical protein
MERGDMLELIALVKLDFCGRDWKFIGSKEELGRKLHNITGIPHAVLDGVDEPWSHSVAARMTWARGRSTTKLEDRAYSLMGIFRINMPLVYGERHNAFKRLQDEIMRTHDDLSIFLHGPTTGPPPAINYVALEGSHAKAGAWDRCNALALSPDDFPQDRSGQLKEVTIDFD